VIVECPIDEMNKPRRRKQAALRIPPTEAEVAQLFAGWRQELVACRKFAPAARHYIGAKLRPLDGHDVLRHRTVCEGEVHQLHADGWLPDQETGGDQRLAEWWLAPP
jgi:hypothetical protein